MLRITTTVIMKFIIILWCIAMFECRPIGNRRIKKRSPNDTPVNDVDFLAYLMKYNYLSAALPQEEQTDQANTSSQFAAISQHDAITAAIKEFQQFAHVPVTGIIDKATEEMMRRPRCGNTDKDAQQNQGRSKRYILQGSKWSHNELTYRIDSFTRDLDRDTVDQIFKEAFKMWADASRLNFQQVSGIGQSADIAIMFASRDHGDGNDFDGYGNVLAHAYYPQYGGGTHFDEDEYWTHGSAYGSNLLQVAVHEFGHSLGLEHSKTSGAVMAPFYVGYDPGFSLSQDDVYGIQYLYGAAQNDVGPNDIPSTPPSDPPAPKPDHCQDASVDAIGVAFDKEGTIFAFKGDYFLQLTALGAMPGFPKPISSVWSRLSGPVDAMLVLAEKYQMTRQYFRFVQTLVQEERWYLFKGNLVYLYNNRRNLQLGYPRPISYEFPGIPDNIDAAFVWSRNGRIYFIKDRVYYRFDVGPIVNGRQQIGSVPAGYPRSTAFFRGISGQITAALQYRNQRTYFFVRDQYYKIDDRTMKASVGYPRSTAKWWFGCADNLQQIEADNVNDEELLSAADITELDSGASTCSSGQWWLVVTLLGMLFAHYLA